MRFFLLVVAILALLLVRVPATLFDRMAAAVGAGGVRLGATEGTVWSGHGTIAVLEATSRSWHRWREVQWTFDPIGLFRGQIAWKIIFHEERASTLALGIGGWEVTHLKLLGPASYFLQRLPGPLGKLGWRGDVYIEADRFACSWQGSCQGKAEVEWNDAESDFLPGLVFGDYRVVAQGLGEEIVLDWTSSEFSAVNTQGKGRIMAGSLAGLAGSIRGDSSLLGRLPAIAGPWARPTASPETWEIVYP